MDSECDPEREAMAAIELAAATHGADRQRWIGIAQAWLELARRQHFAATEMPHDQATSAAASGGHSGHVSSSVAHHR